MLSRPPAPETAATQLADAIRKGEQKGSPTSLHSLSANKADYKHAMIHAGWLVPVGPGGVPGPPYIVCPGCGAHLLDQEDGE